MGGNGVSRTWGSARSAAGGTGTNRSTILTLVGVLFAPMACTPHRAVVDGSALRTSQTASITPPSALHPAPVAPSRPAASTRVVTQPTTPEQKPNERGWRALQKVPVATERASDCRLCTLTEHPWGRVTVVGPFPRAFVSGAPNGFVAAHQLYATAAANVRSRKWRELRRAPCGWGYDGAIATKDEPGRAVVLDEKGRVRVYLEDGGGEENINIARLYFDGEGRPRFMFWQIRSYYHGSWDELFALDVDGNVVAAKSVLLDEARVAGWAREIHPDELLSEDCVSEPCPPCAEAGR